MENRQYFVLRGKDKTGPYTVETLKDIGIDHNTRIWHSGLSKWTRASELPELSDVFTAPPNTSSSKRTTVILLAVVVLIAAAFMSYRFLSKPKTVTKQFSSLTNEQLYKLYSPSVVLIQHRYMYEVNAGEKKFYFNDYYNYGNEMGYLVGLTEDSAKAAEQAEPMQGTGFFIESDGKILTNRHVAKPAPSEDEQYNITKYFFQSLNGKLASVNFMDSIKRNKSENDSLLSVLLQDSATNATEIAGIKQKISDAEGIIEEEGDSDEPGLSIDSATIDYIKNQSVEIKKITLELRAFLPGSQTYDDGSGINCKVISTSQDENVDLALIQTNSKTLPNAFVKIVDLSRIKNCDGDNSRPQMSERLILIGYNRGTELATTTAGIQSQLTDGKVSQNTDAFRLMYTIPTLPGSSGSPVMDDKGRLVSVNFAGMTQTQSFNYGIQPAQIRGFLSANEISF